MNALAREQCRCGLAAEVLQSQGTLQVRTTGVSMLPTLWPGDLVTIRSHTLQQAKPGEIVLYRREGRFFIHRSVKKFRLGEELLLITRGDSMPKDDPPVCAGELLGKVTEIRRQGRLMTPSRRLSLLRLILGQILCHSDLSQRVALRLHSRRSADSGLSLTGQHA